MRLSAPSKLFAQRRETIDVAYPGDIVGFVNPGAFSIGDTISVTKGLLYDGIPSFSPELFNYIRNMNPSKRVRPPMLYPSHCPPTSEPHPHQTRPPSSEPPPAALFFAHGFLKTPNLGPRDAKRPLRGRNSRLDPPARGSCVAEIICTRGCILNTWGPAA